MCEHTVGLWTTRQFSVAKWLDLVQWPLMFRVGDLHRPSRQHRDSLTLCEPLSTSSHHEGRSGTCDRAAEAKEILMLRPIITILAVASFATAASAQNLPPEANSPAVKAAQAACAQDIKKFCAAIEPGGGRIVRCLAGNASQLSAGCKSSMLSAKSALGR